MVLAVVKSHLQHYVEPAGSSAPIDPVTTVTSSINSTLLPLGTGTFTHNVAGVPIVVVCTKADLIDEEEDVALGTVKGKGGEWEERTDGVMQVLRTICLKCEQLRMHTNHVVTNLCNAHRRSGSILYYPTTLHPFNTTPIRPPFPICSPSATSRFTTPKVPIFFPASTQHTGSRSNNSTCWLGQLGKDRCSTRWF